MKGKEIINCSVEIGDTDSINNTETIRRKNGFCRLIPWTEISSIIEERIDIVFRGRNKINPDLNDSLFGKNRTADQCG